MKMGCASPSEVKVLEQGVRSITARGDSRATSSWVRVGPEDNLLDSDIRCLPAGHAAHSAREWATEAVAVLAREQTARASSSNAPAEVRAGLKLRSMNIFCTRAGASFLTVESIPQS
jgi:hypothetical protein